jgi:hypothetical protein
MTDSSKLTDSQLLGELHEKRDYLTGEVFRALYGRDYRRHFDAYKKSGALPAQARRACEALLDSGTPLEKLADRVLPEPKPARSPLAAVA